MSLATGVTASPFAARAGRIVTSAPFARLVLLGAFLLFWEFGAAWWGDRAMVRPLSEVVQALFNRILSDPRSSPPSASPSSSCPSPTGSRSWSDWPSAS